MSLSTALTAMRALWDDNPRHAIQTAMKGASQLALDAHTVQGLHCLIQFAGFTCLEPVGVLAGLQLFLQRSSYYLQHWLACNGCLREFVRRHCVLPVLQF